MFVGSARTAKVRGREKVKTRLEENDVECSNSIKEDKGIGMTICSSDATFALPLALSLKKRKEIVKLKKELKRFGGNTGE